MTTGIVAKTRSKTACRLHYKKVERKVNLPALSELYSRLKSPSILGGNIAKLQADGFSYWAAEPKKIFEFVLGQDDPLGKLQRLLNKYSPLTSLRILNHTTSIKNANDNLPDAIFCGGWIGYFGYELCRYIEKISVTTDDLRVPLIRLCFYDRLIAYDHNADCFWLVALGLPDDCEEICEKISALERLLGRAQEIHLQTPEPFDLDGINFSQIRSNMDKIYYLKMVERIKRYIYDGDVYQVNFSQRFECDYTARPIDLYHWQNYYNPSGYAAYIDAGDFCIVSASPEMFLTIDNGTIRTKPIKGTRPHLPETPYGNPLAKQINAKNYSELLNSEKEQAELNMIIDLERNDLARVCKPGTRSVTQPRTIEEYPTVFHAVATVGGELRADVSFCDVLRATFPGGSITGAPKIRAMEIISETEPTARGVYTGGIGFVGIDGSACLNIAIRTIIIKDGKGYAQTGGGIVSDSEAQAEWQETITKAKALLAGIQGVVRCA